tara:strand:- start:30681 stop:31064 length:384 start_codon:yes stop_codon:yes gene_type:complete
MKVRCIRLIAEESGDILESSVWLTIDKEYLVLSVHVDGNGQVSFQLVGDDEFTPAFHRAEQFNIVSNLIPSIWCVDYAPGGAFDLVPRAWREKGFWEKFFDGESDARALFRSEVQAMLDEESSNTTS